MTTNDGFEKYDTSPLTPQNGLMVRPRSVEKIPEDSSTGKQTPKTGRTVPSSQTEGSVWLRYTPREPGSGDLDISTET